MSTSDDHNDLSNIKSHNQFNSDVNTTSANHDNNTDNKNNKIEASSPKDIKLMRPVSRHHPKLSVSFSEAEVQVQHQVAQHQLSIHRQNSLRLSNYKKKQNNDLESRVNRM